METLLSFNRQHRHGMAQRPDVRHRRLCLVRPFEECPSGFDELLPDPNVSDDPRKVTAPPYLERAPRRGDAALGGRDNYEIDRQVL